MIINVKKTAGAYKCHIIFKLKFQQHFVLKNPAYVAKEFQSNSCIQWIIV